MPRIGVFPEDIVKLSKQTIAILQWCSAIQEDLLLESGNRIRTISSNKAILFDSTVAETFPKRIALRRISRALSYIDESTEISFENPTHLELQNGRTLTRVSLVDEKLVFSPPSKNIRITDFDESIFLHSDDVYEIRRLKGEDTVVEFHSSGNGEQILMDYFDKEEGAPIHTMKMVKPQNGRREFRARLKVSNLKLWEGSYQLDIASAGVARFSWLNGNVVLWVAIEAAHSHFSAVTPTVTTAASVAVVTSSTATAASTSRS